MPRPIARLIFAWLLFVPGLSAIAEEKSPEPQRLDRYGDPLPPGAVARLGTLRLVGDHWSETVAFSPDGKLLASGGRRTPIRLWDVSTGGEIRQLRGHEENDYPSRYHNFSLAFSLNGRWLCSGSKDKTIHVWEVSTGKVMRPLRGHTDAVFGLACSPDGKLLASASADGSVRLWDLTRGKELRRLAGHRNGAWTVAFSPDGKRLASSGYDGTLSVWDVEGREIAVIHPRWGGVGSDRVAFSPDGKWLATGSTKWIAHVWDIASKKEVVRLSGRREEEGNLPNNAGPLAFTPDGQRLITGGEDGAVRVWDLARGKEEHCFRFVSGPVHSLALSPGGKVLAVLGGGRRLYLCDFTTGKEVHGWAAHAGPILSATFSGSQRLCSVSEKTACEWEPSTGKALSQHPLFPGPTRPKILALAPGGRFLASWEVTRFTVWDVATSKRVWSPQGVKHPGLQFDFTPDGKTAAFSDHIDKDGDSILVWDLARNKEVRHIRGRDLCVSCLAVSPDGKMIASDHRTKQLVVVWDVATGKELRRLDLGGDAARHLAFSPDGALLAAACVLKLACLWDLKSGKELHRCVSDDEYEYLHCIAFAPDGRSLAWAGSNGIVRLWEVCTGRERCRFKGHRDKVTCLAWSPNGRLLASGSDDTTLLVWDVAGTTLAPRRSAELTREQLASLWDDLASADAARAYRSMKKLAAAPRQATAFLADHLRAARPAARERTASLLARLDSRQFAERERAVRALEQLGLTAEVALLKARADRPSLEVRRRIDRLLERLDGALKWQTLRALEVLEWLGTPDVQAVLRELAKGDDPSTLTREAKATLARLQANVGD